MSEPTPSSTSSSSTSSTWRDRLELIARPPTLTRAQITTAVVVALVVALVGWFVLRQPPGPPPEQSLPRAGAGAGASPVTSAPTQLVVDAAGAVQTPGVYKLAPGSRVTDLIDAAGGAAPDADLDRVNLAAPLVDGARLYVPKVGEASGICLFMPAAAHWR